MANQYSYPREEEITFIKENYNKLSAPQIAKKLNRSLTFVYKRLKEIDDFKTELWTDEEILYLKENYLIKTYKEIGIDIDKSKSAIEGKLRSLDLSKDDNAKPWTDNQIELLKANIDSLNYIELAKLIGRSPQSIRKKATTLGLLDDEFKGSYKLKKEQQLFIINNAMKMTDTEFARKFKVSVEAVEEVRKKHGIVKVGNEVKGKTYIEQIVAEYLDNLNVVYDFNKTLGNYRPDFKISGKKMIIEVQGDYWHCNPKLYSDGPKDEIQIRHVVQDYYKRCYFESRGYEIIYIWEHDIENDIENVKEKIKSAVLG